MGTVTLQTISQDAFPLYEQTHSLPAHVRKAARAILQCRTAALAAMCKRVPMAMCPASGTIPVGIDRAPNARISRRSAGSPSSRGACSPVTITM